MGTLATVKAQMEGRPHNTFFFGGGLGGGGVIPCDYQHHDLSVSNFMENSVSSGCRASFFFSILFFID